MTQTLNVVLIVDGNGIEGAALTIKSVLFKSKPSTIHVVDMGMSASDAETLRQIAPCVRIVAVPDTVLGWLDQFSLHGFRHVSRAAYAKLQMHRLLPDVERVIYLDTDTLVLADLAELNALDLGANPIGATWTAYQMEEGKQRLGLSDRYFNSGVLLCQLSAWRDSEVDQQFMDWYRINHTRMKFNDQEILNGVFDGRNREIGKRWNVSHLEIFRVGNQAGVALKDTGVLHFNGPQKPWQADYEANTILNKKLFLPIRIYLARLQSRGVGDTGNAAALPQRAPGM